MGVYVRVNDVFVCGVSVFGGVAAEQIAISITPRLVFLFQRDISVKLPET